MRLIKAGDRIINLGLVAYVERAGDIVSIHFAVTKANLIPLDYDPSVTGPPVASDHVILMLGGAEGDALWKDLESFIDTREA